MFFKSWIKYRFDILGSIIFDLILCFYILQNGNLSRSFPEKTLFLIIWIFLSYNFERYGRLKRINFKNLLLKNLKSEY